MTPAAEPDADILLRTIFQERGRRVAAIGEIEKEQQRIRAAERFRRKFYSYFPDEGPLRRELYPKHMEFFAAGATFRERAFIAANRTGKTDAGSYEATAHLTGDYPHWWVGKRFDRPIKAWAAGNTTMTVRDILQAKLIGRIKKSTNKEDDDVVIGLGTGMIPGASIIGQPRPRSGVPDAIDTVYVRHKSGGASVLNFKSYESGSNAFEGTEQDFIWADEEVPQEVYTECLMRTMTNNGCIALTFTPLQGLTPVVLSFMPGGAYPEGGIVP